MFVPVPVISSAMTAVFDNKAAKILGYRIKIEQEKFKIPERILAGAAKERKTG